MNDDELYELAKERIANDNGKRYSQEEIMEEFGIDEDDDFYEEKPLIDDFVDQIRRCITMTYNQNSLTFVLFFELFKVESFGVIFYNLQIFACSSW